MKDKPYRWNRLCSGSRFVICPRELHDLHSDYPLAAEKLRITRNMLSPYFESLVCERFMVQKKLLPKHYEKSKYVTHYENL